METDTLRDEVMLGCNKLKYRRFLDSQLKKHDDFKG